MFLSKILQLWEMYLPDYYQYHPIIVNKYDGLDSIRYNTHLLVIQNESYNPLYDKVNSGYWWLGTDAVSNFEETYLWCFIDWIKIKSDKNINNHFNEILYKTSVIFGNNPENVQNKFGKADSIIKKQIYDKEFVLLHYNGLQVEGFNNLSDFYHDESFLYKLYKIIVTKPKYGENLPFNIGDNINKAKNYIHSRYLKSENDSTIVFEKQRDDFGGYENHKFIIKFKDNIIKEFEWQYGTQYNL